MHTQAVVLSPSMAALIGIYDCLEDGVEGLASASSCQLHFEEPLVCMLQVLLCTYFFFCNKKLDFTISQ